MHRQLSVLETREELEKLYPFEIRFATVGHSVQATRADLKQGRCLTEKINTPFDWGEACKRRGLTPHLVRVTEGDTERLEVHGAHYTQTMIVTLSSRVDTAFKQLTEAFEGLDSLKRSPIDADCPFSETEEEKARAISSQEKYVKMILRKVLG